MHIKIICGIKVFREILYVINSFEDHLDLEEEETNNIETIEIEVTAK